MPTIHLQGTSGEVPAVLATDLKPGDRVAFNQGTVSTVKSITQIAPKTVRIVWILSEGTEVGNHVCDQEETLACTYRVSKLFARVEA